MAWMIQEIGLTWLFTATAAAQESKPRIVGAKQAAPFSFRTEAGAWRGIRVELRAKHRRRRAPRRALQSLSSGETRAIVYDAPILRHLALTTFPDTVSVLPITFERQDHAIALRPNGPLKNAVHRALHERVSSEDGSNVLHRYLGANQ